MNNKTYLRNLKAEDFKIFEKYSQDKEVSQFTGFIVTKEAKKLGVKAYIKSKEGLSFAVCEVISGEAIGDIGMEVKDNNIIEIGITIFNKSYWDRGYGKDALIQFIDYINQNNQKQINKIILSVNKKNIRAIKCYEGIGFKVTSDNKENLKEYLMFLNL